MSESVHRMPTDIEGMRVSAIQLAELSGLRTEDIHYWARKGYITRNTNGSKRPFAMSDLPKVELMGKLTRRYDLEAVKASRLADDLLEMHADEPDAYLAGLALLDAFDKSLKTLARVLTKVGFLDALVETGLVDAGELSIDPIATRRNGRKKKEAEP